MFTLNHKEDGVKRQISKCALVTAVGLMWTLLCN